MNNNLLPVVRLEPSGHTFEVAPGQTVVQAALGAGVHVPYGCNNGTCGECAARLIAGELTQIRHHDYVLDAARKREGCRLICCCAPTGNVVLEIDEAVTGAPLPVVDLTVKLQKLEQLSGNAYVARLRSSRARLLRYLSGQRIQMLLDDVPPALLQLASCPCEGPNLEIHVDVEQHPALINSLKNLRRGANIPVRGPFGGFGLVATSATVTRVVLLASDTGFAAVQGLLNQLINVEFTGAIRVVWCARTAIKHYREPLLRSLAAAFDNLEYSLVDSTGAPGEWDRVLADEANAWIGTGAFVYLATGPQGADIRARLLALGMLPQQIVDEWQLVSETVAAAQTESPFKPV